MPVAPVSALLTLSAVEDDSIPEAVARGLERGPLVQRLVFGDVEDAAVVDAVSRFCRTHLGAEVAEVVFRAVSVGVVFGLQLEDGKRIVIKAHQPRQPREFLQAVHNIQAHLHRAGVPAPAPLLGPRPLGNGLAVVEELLDRGDYRDAHDPAIRTTLARMLVEVVRLARACGRPDALRGRWRLFADSGRLWPHEAHSPIFDFGATAAGAEWIDAIARKAKPLTDHRRSEELVGHDDWSAKHFRFLDDRTISAIYDWDSIVVETEARIVGIAASTFTANPNLDVQLAPTPEQTGAFLDDYFAARGRPGSRAEREEFAAAACFVVCYVARCEHALGRPGDFTDALATSGSAYLSA